METLKITTWLSIWVTGTIYPHSLMSVECHQNTGRQLASSYCRVEALGESPTFFWKLPKNEYHQQEALRCWGTRAATAVSLLEDHS